MPSKSRNLDLKRYSHTGLSVEELNKLREAFDLFDVHGRGVVECSELRTILISTGFASKDSTIFKMLSDLQTKEESGVTFDDFIQIFSQCSGVHSTDRGTLDPGEVERIFRLFDSEGKGSINILNLDLVCKELGEKISKEELLEMIQRADSDGDGEVSIDDFYKILTRRVAR